MKHVLMNFSTILFTILWTNVCNLWCYSITSSTNVCDLYDDDLIVSWDTLFSGIDTNFTSALSLNHTQLHNSSVNTTGIIFNSSNVDEIIDYIVSTSGDEEVVRVIATSKYVVRASYSPYSSIYSDIYNDSLLGVTIVIDAQEFEDEGRLLQDANACENRLSTSYVNKSFINDFWSYTSRPSSSDPKRLGNDKYGLEYPNPNIWNVSMRDPVNDSCGLVQWESNFTVAQLYHLCNFTFNLVYSDDYYYDDSNGVYVDAAWLLLSGKFYMNIVSPNPLFLEACDGGEIDCGRYLAYTFRALDIKLKWKVNVTGDGFITSTDATTMNLTDWQLGSSTTQETTPSNDITDTTDTTESVDAPGSGDDAFGVLSLSFVAYMSCTCVALILVS